MDCMDAWWRNVVTQRIFHLISIQTGPSEAVELLEDGVLLLDKQTAAEVTVFSSSNEDEQIF